MMDIPGWVLARLTGTERCRSIPVTPGAYEDTYRRWFNVFILGLGH